MNLTITAIAFRSSKHVFASPRTTISTRPSVQKITNTATTHSFSKSSPKRSARLSNFLSPKKP